MAITLPHIEDSNRTTYFPPVGVYETFADDEHYAQKLKEWGLSTAKKEFWYKEKDHQRLVSIKGYQVYGETDDFNTIIIEFQDGNLSCIHPAFLKEMQSSNYGKNTITATSKSSGSVFAEQTNPRSEKLESKIASTKEKPTKKTKENKAATTIKLPEEKIHFKAKVKQFALTWNHFNEDNDEVIVLENVVIQLEEPIQIGLAWCSHSKTLKKLELSPGEELEFDGKIVKKKLAKGKEVEEKFIVNEPIPYKINNPSKIKKREKE